MVGIGETVSTIALFVQSELIFLLEDTIWAVHTVYMCVLSYPQPVHMAFFGLFGAHMFISHLPGRFGLLLSRGRSTSKTSPLFTTNPLFTGKGFGKILIQRSGDEERAWVVPMLLGQPLLMLYMYNEINNRV